ncbi:hypothetical protein F2Q69_00028668 [Brassica cretica]|uniref:Uncharacterized protein n=1 Tax=Brassica cretica TaxID=69181 RepID=A0A8S9RZW1_BRACR|nr:hypothetical protein F2Q69_00028668 [Brassica cretica]
MTRRLDMTIGALCGLLYRYIDGGLGIWQEAESPPCWSRGWLLIEELYGYLEICHCSVLGLRIWKSQQGRRHLIHGCIVIKGLSDRVHPISPSPKVFLILDELSLSSFRSQLTSRTATTRVPDQTRSVPARASARVRSSSFQLAFQLVPARIPACSSSHSSLFQLEVLLVVWFYNLQNLKYESHGIIDQYPMSKSKLYKFDPDPKIEI